MPRFPLYAPGFDVIAVVRANSAETSATRPGMRTLHRTFRGRSAGPGNPKLVAARRARGRYSQEEFVAAFDAHARVLGVDVSVSTRQARRWESPDPPWPRPTSRRVLTSLLGVPIDQLGFTPPQLEPTETADSEDLTPCTVVPFSRQLLRPQSGVFDGDLVRVLLPTEPASTHDGTSLAPRVTLARSLVLHVPIRRTQRHACCIDR